MTFDPDKRKLLSILCHGATFVSYLGAPIGIPIAVLLISDDPVVKENARESLNFHFNIWIYSFIGWLLTILGIGLIILGFVILASTIFPILAILSVLKDENVPYKYPFIFHFL